MQVTEPMNAGNLTLAVYQDIQSGIVTLLESARIAAARSVNALMTASYWEIGRRIVACEQGGEERAGYGEALIRRLAVDLTQRFGRGFSERNLEQMRKFHISWPIPQTVSAEFTDLAGMARRFPLPWSAYVCLLSVRDPAARAFYEAEALRGGWSVRQLDRQVNSMLYERALLSRNKVAMLEQGALTRPGDRMTPEEAIRDPFVLEFLDLEDTYSESELEAALIQHLADFLLELGDGFTFDGTHPPRAGTAPTARASGTAPARAPETKPHPAKAEAQRGNLNRPIKRPLSDRGATRRSWFPADPGNNDSCGYLNFSATGPWSGTSPGTWPSTAWAPTW